MDFTKIDEEFEKQFRKKWSGRLIHEAVPNTPFGMSSENEFIEKWCLTFFHQAITQTLSDERSRFNQLEEAKGL